jgi:hypothetical protein
MWMVVWLIAAKLHSHHPGHFHQYPFRSAPRCRPTPLLPGLRSVVCDVRCVYHSSMYLYIYGKFVFDKPPNGWAPRSPYIVRVLPITHSRSIHSGTMLHASPSNAQVASLPSGLKGGRYWLYRRRASLGMLSKRVWPVAVPGRCASRRVGDVRLLKTSSRLLFTGLAGPYASD